MKFRLEHFLSLITIAGWIIIAWVVVDYNFGLGSTTLRWPNPAHPTAAWTWDARETTPTVLEPQTGQWLRVTLPRGFVNGSIAVATQESAEIIIRAESKTGDPGITKTSRGTDHSLSFAWKNLIARGKTFRFRLENPTAKAITIENVSLNVSR